MTKLENSVSKIAEILETNKQTNHPKTCHNTSFITNSYQQQNSMKEYSAWTLF